MKSINTILGCIGALSLIASSMLLVDSLSISNKYPNYSSECFVVKTSGIFELDPPDKFIVHGITVTPPSKFIHTDNYDYLFEEEEYTNYSLNPVPVLVNKSNQLVLYHPSEGGGIHTVMAPHNQTESTLPYPTPTIDESGRSYIDFFIVEDCEDVECSNIDDHEVGYSYECRYENLYKTNIKYNIDEFEEGSKGIWIDGEWEDTKTIGLVIFLFMTVISILACFTKTKYEMAKKVMGNKNQEMKILA